MSQKQNYGKSKALVSSSRCLQAISWNWYDVTVPSFDAMCHLPQPMNCLREILGPKNKELVVLFEEWLHKTNRVEIQRKKAFQGQQPWQCCPKTDILRPYCLGAGCLVVGGWITVGLAWSQVVWLGPYGFLRWGPNNKQYRSSHYMYSKRYKIKSNFFPPSDTRGCFLHQIKRWDRIELLKKGLLSIEKGLEFLASSTFPSRELLWKCPPNKWVLDVLEAITHFEMEH